MSELFSTTTNLSHIRRQLRKNQMLDETDFPNSDRKVKKTLPSNKVTPSKGNMNNNIWPAPTEFEDEGNGGDTALERYPYLFPTTDGPVNYAFLIYRPALPRPHTEQTLSSFLVEERNQFCFDV